MLYKPWHEAWENQQCGFWPGLTQTRLYSYLRWLEAWNFSGEADPRSWSASLFSHMQIVGFSHAGAYIVFNIYKNSSVIIIVKRNFVKKQSVLDVSCWVIQSSCNLLFVGRLSRSNHEHVAIWFFCLQLTEQGHLSLKTND